jgi:putative component of toxin-antitoxin plasmid stabilization module
VNAEPLNPGFAQRGRALVILLAAGDKRTQDTDIKKALKLAREL